MSSWHCVAFITVYLLNWVIFFILTIISLCYTHHKEQEGVALHTLAVCPPHYSSASVERKRLAGFCATRKGEALPWEAF